jgi:hypothetical protein
VLKFDGNRQLVAAIEAAIDPSRRTPLPMALSQISTLVAS